MKSISLIFAMLCVSVCAVADVTVLTPHQFVGWQQAEKEFLLLDVRSLAEYRQGHIKGAVNVEYTALAIEQEKLNVFKKKEVVVYCRSGRRAAIAEAYLIQHGFKRVYHLQGDMNAWSAAGRELVTP